MIAVYVMKPLRLFVLALMLFFLAGSVQAANSDFLVGVTVSPTNPAPNSKITYTINITNASSVVATSVQIVNAFSSAFTLTGNSTTLQSATISTNANSATINILNFGPGPLSAGTLTLEVLPQATSGDFTDVISIQASGFTGTNVSAKVTIQPAFADLGVQVSQTPNAILIGDQFTYRVTLTNAGPSDATPNVVLQTTLSPEIPRAAISVDPEPSGGISYVGGVLTMNVGTITNKGSKAFSITLAPATTNTLKIITAVTPPVGQNSDTNSVNDSVTNLLTIQDIVLDTLKILSVTPLAFNPQTGLMDQYVTVQNISAGSIPSVRLVATNLLAPNRLYNATGTNRGLPYVATVSPLASGDSVTLHLELYFADRSSANVVSLVPVQAPAPNMILPAGTAVQKKLVITGPTVLIEFPSTVGKSYAVLYGPDATFTNFLAARPFITAVNSRTQFIDDGPPKTTAAPTNATSRIYQVIELP